MYDSTSHIAPGIAVPVPGAAEVAALLDDADVVDARLAQPRAGEQAAEAAADDDDLDLVGQRLALDRRDVRVVEVVRELAGDLDVLLVAVRRRRLSRSSRYFSRSASGSNGRAGSIVGSVSVDKVGPLRPCGWAGSRHRRAGPRA